MEDFREAHRFIAQVEKEEAHAQDETAQDGQQVLSAAQLVVAPHDSGHVRGFAALDWEGGDSGQHHRRADEDAQGEVLSRCFFLSLHVYIYIYIYA